MRGRQRSGHCVGRPATEKVGSLGAGQFPSGLRSWPGVTPAAGFSAAGVPLLRSTGCELVPTREGIQRALAERVTHLFSSAIARGRATHSKRLRPKQRARWQPDEARDLLLTKNLELRQLLRGQQRSQAGCRILLNLTLLEAQRLG